MRMQYERQPSEEQRAIIEEPNLAIPLKVVAGAGTGKTFVLAHRFVWLVVEKGLAPDRLLALTFTDNAATEMRTRIRRLLRLNRYPEPLPSLWVHTFHSFCARLLRDNAYRAGLNPEPALVTEIEEALYLDTLLNAVFQGEFAHLAALAPDRLADLGVEKPEQLRRLLLTLVQEAKGAGQTPEEFRHTALEQSKRFWSLLPTAAEAQQMDQHDLARLVITRATSAFGLTASLDGLQAGHTRELRKLYFSDIRRKPPTPRPDAQALLDQAWKAEQALIEAAAAIYQAYLNRLTEEGALDYDGQIMQAVALLQRLDLGLSAHYRDYFQYILIDEFQDTSLSQLELVRLLARPRTLEVRSPDGQVRRERSYERLLVVGDQKQSIYGWRQARPENLDALLPMVEGETVEGVPISRPLTESHRLTPALTEVANRAGRAARPQDPELKPANPATGAVLFPAPFSGEHGVRLSRRAEAAFIADQIRRWQESGEIADLSEIAVLIRKRRFFRPLKVAFERRGLPYQAQGGVGFFEHPLARDVIAWLQVLRDPQQDLYLTRLLTREPYALSDGALYLLLTTPTDGTRKRRPEPMLVTLQRFLAGEDDREPAERSEIPAERLRAFAEQYAALRDLAARFSAREVLEAVWQHCAEHVALSPSEEQAVSTVRATFDGLIEQVSGRRPPPLEDLVQALDLYLQEDYRELPVVDQPVRGAVRIMTIHRAKGLGFEAVFLPAWKEQERGGPRYDRMWGLLGLKVGGEDPKSAVHKLVQQAASSPEDDEALRLAYVGVTRAKRLLCVTRAQGRRGLPPYPAADYFASVPETPIAQPPLEGEEREFVRPAPGLRLSRDLSLAPDLVSVSYTQLRRLEDCPRAWWLSRQAPADWEREPESDGDRAAEVGSRFHRFVAEHYRTRASPGSAPTASPPPHLTTGLSEGEAARLSNLVSAFLTSEWATPSPPLEVERPVHLVLPASALTVRVTGIIDLLLAADLQIVDFKTEQEITTSARANYALQMYVYREALRSETGREPPSPVLIHVRPNGLEALRFTPAELAAQSGRLQALLERLAAHVSGAPCPPVPGPHCAWCAYAAVCLEGG